MKKVLFTIAAVALAVAANAQFVVGGNLMFGRSSNSHELNGTEIYPQGNITSLLMSSTSINNAIVNQPTTNTLTNLQFTPHVGYRFNDKIEAGIYLGYTTSHLNCPFNEDDYFAKYISNEFDGGLYFRYNYAQLGKFRFFAELFAGIYIQQSKIKYNVEVIGEDEITWENTKFGEIDFHQNINKTFGFEAQITPGVEYAFNDHFSAELFFNFLTLGYTNATTTYKSEDMLTNKVNEHKQHMSNYGLNIHTTEWNSGDFSLQDILNNIGFGIKYKF